MDHLLFNRKFSNYATRGGIQFWIMYKFQISLNWCLYKRADGQSTATTNLRSRIVFNKERYEYVIEYIYSFLQFINYGSVWKFLPLDLPGSSMILYMFKNNRNANYNSFSQELLFVGINLPNWIGADIMDENDFWRFKHEYNRKENADLT